MRSLHLEFLYFHNDILSEFLMKHGGDVVNILNRELTIEEEKEIWAEVREEARAEKIAGNFFCVISILFFMI